MVRKLFVALVCLTAAPASAQQRMLTLDDIYGVTTRVNFSGAPAPAFACTDGDHYAFPRPSGERGLVDWMSVDAATGASTPLCGSAARPRNLSFDARYASALLTMGDDLYVLTCGNGALARLTTSAGEKNEATLSPDGK